MKNILKWAGIVFLGLIVMSVLVGIFGSKNKTAVTAANASTKDSVTTTAGETKTDGETKGETKTTGETAAPAATQSAWTYTESDDKMSSKKDYYATVDAKEELDFKFPYNGGSVATLSIVKRSTGNTDIAVSVTKGQIMAAHGLGNGKVNIRFDESPAQSNGVTSAADGSSNVIFLQGSAKLLAKLKTAKTMYVQAEFYDNGTHVMEFNVAGLDWKH